MSIAPGDSRGIVTRLLRADDHAIREAANVLAAGGLVGFPTETVYGLGARADDDAAVASLYAAKQRPAFNPLIAHVRDLAAARAFADFGPLALRLAEAFWPGPLTLVLRQLPDAPVGRLATAGLDTIAVRVPSHPVARDILSAFGHAVVAPSANRSGRVSPTSAEHVLADLDGRIDLIVDGGTTEVGVESTILACFDGPVMLRPGAVPREAIQRLIGAPVPSFEEPSGAGHTPLAPGMLASHYAPRAAVHMNAVAVEPGEALLAFGHLLPPGIEQAAAVLNLSERGSPIEAAANLFAYLRHLDSLGAGRIAVMRIPEDGLGEAINDRLRHAAAPRDSANV